MMVTVGYIIRSIDLVTSYLLLSPVRHHNHLRTGSCCGAVVPGNVTRPHPRSAYVDVSPHLHTTRVTWPHVSSTQTRRGDWFYCKLVLVCKMRITGGPGPGFAQQHRHQITSCTLAPESFPDLAGHKKLDTAVTRVEHLTSKYLYFMNLPILYYIRLTLS